MHTTFDRLNQQTGEICARSLKPEPISVVKKPCNFKNIGCGLLYRGGETTELERAGGIGRDDPGKFCKALSIESKRLLTTEI